MEKKNIERVISDRLSRTSGIDFEIFLARKKVVSIGIKDGSLDHFRSSNELGLALRVLEEGRLGFAYLFGPSPEGLDHLADQALELAGQSDVDPNYSFSSESKPASNKLELFDESIETIPEKEKIARVKEMEQSALNYDPRIKKARKAEYQEVTNYASLTNSGGLNLERKDTQCSMSIMILAEDNSSSEMGWDLGAARFYKDLDPINIGRTAANRSIQMLGSRPISTARLPAVLENRVVVDVLEAWASSFYGENVYKGKSFLKGKINQVVASPSIQLTDDGLYPKGMGSAPFDDEGIPQAKTILVKDGTLVSYLLDGYWSKKMESEPTGNSFRSQIASPPTTSVSNLFIDSGSSSPEQLLSKMDDGVFITEVMGAHTIDPVSGEFSLGASGMRIQNGKPAFPVKGVTISGTIYDLFSSVIELGDDLRFLGRIGAPSVLLREIIVSGE
ncbi:MAG: TldD/PmbA family protein [Thermodesulfobacteriota bacterium]